MADGSNVVSIGQGRRGRRASAWEPWSEVKRLAQKPGRHRIGPNCELEVREPGKASLNFRYQFEGRERRMGLGRYQLAAPAELRDRVVDLQRKLRDGLDPLEEKAGAKQAAVAARAGAVTFDTLAERYIATHEPAWRNPKHRQQWRSTIAAYALRRSAPCRSRPSPSTTCCASWSRSGRPNRDGLQAPRAPRSDPRCFSAARSGQPGELARAAEGEPSRWAQGEAGRTSCGPALAGDSEFHTRLRGQAGVSARALEFAIFTSLVGPARCAARAGARSRARCGRSRLPGPRRAGNTACRCPTPAVAVLQAWSLTGGTTA